MYVNNFIIQLWGQNLELILKMNTDNLFRLVF